MLARAVTTLVFTLIAFHAQAEAPRPANTFAPVAPSSNSPTPVPTSAPVSGPVTSSAPVPSSAPVAPACPAGYSEEAEFCLVGNNGQSSPSLAVGSCDAVVPKDLGVPLFATLTWKYTCTFKCDCPSNCKALDAANSCAPTSQTSSETFWVGSGSSSGFMISESEPENGFNNFRDARLACERAKAFDQPYANRRAATICADIDKKFRGVACGAKFLCCK